MNRLLIGFLVVLGPVQVGMAATLLVGPEPSRSDVGTGLAIASALGLASVWLMRGRTERELARLSLWWFVWSYLLPQLGIGFLVSTRVSVVNEAWSNYRSSHFERPEPTVWKLGEWTIQEIPATPVTPKGSSASRFQLFLRVLLRELIIHAVRVLWSTPSWVYGLTLMVVLGFRLKR